MVGSPFDIRRVRDKPVLPFSMTRRRSLNHIKKVRDWSLQDNMAYSTPLLQVRHSPQSAMRASPMAHPPGHVVGYTPSFRKPGGPLISSNAAVAAAAATAAGVAAKLPEGQRRRCSFSAQLPTHGRDVNALPLGRRGSFNRPARRFSNPLLRVGQLAFSARSDANTTSDCESTPSLRSMASKSPSLLHQLATAASPVGSRPAIRSLPILPYRAHPNFGFRRLEEEQFAQGASSDGWQCCLRHCHCATLCYNRTRLFIDQLNVDLTGRCGCPSFETRQISCWPKCCGSGSSGHSRSYRRGYCAALGCMCGLLLLIMSGGVVAYAYAAGHRSAMEESASPAWWPSAAQLSALTDETRSKYLHALLRWVYLSDHYSTGTQSSAPQPAAPPLAPNLHRSLTPQLVPPSALPASPPPAATPLSTS